MKDPNALREFLETAAPRTLIGARLGELNVVDELCRRCSDSAALGSALRERDFEAYERLPLVSTTDQTDGLTIARLFGVDASRLEPLRALLDKNQSDRGVRYLPVDTADRERITFIQVRAVLPFSEWRGYTLARAHYEAVRSESDMEKQHVVPGNRSLPCPGVRLTDDDAARALVRAWVLNRLRPTENGRWTVLPASDDDSPLIVSWPLTIAPQLAYQVSVDLVSSFNCYIRASGPGAVRERLSALPKAVSNGSGWAEFLPDPEMLRRAISELQREVDWWECNTHPASYGGRTNGVGR